MNITITFQEGKWVTEPDPAIVVLGTRIQWIVRGPTSEVTRLRWIIDFGKHAPFTGENRQLIVVTTNTGLGRARDHISGFIATALEMLGLTEEALVDHRGATAPVNAEEPGLYKYDLHVEDAETEARLGDDDPQLFVAGTFPPFL